MKKNLFLISENEKYRILNMHKRATASQYLSEQEAVTTTTTTVAVITTTTTVVDPKTTQDPKSQVMLSNDRDYAYKKEGDKYYFKLQPSPASASAQNFLKQGKFVTWTEATGKGLEAIKKLSFKPDAMATLSTKDPSRPQTLSTTAQTAAPVTPLATGGGSQPTGQAVTTQTNPQIAQDLKSASQIRQEFRQGKRDVRKLQRERDKLYNTYNKLSGKMDKATDDSYIQAISQLDQLMKQK